MQRNGPDPGLLPSSSTRATCSGSSLIGTCPQPRSQTWRASGSARPRSLSPADANDHLEALLNGPGFHPVLEQLRGHRFDGRLEAPATIAWGTRDALLLPTQALRARRALPEARHVWLHGCGHVPMSDDPDLVARVLLEGSAAGAQKAVASAHAHVLAAGEKLTI